MFRLPKNKYEQAAMTAVTSVELTDENIREIFSTWLLLNYEQRKLYQRDIAVYFRLCCEAKLLGLKREQ